MADPKHSIEMTKVMWRTTRTWRPYVILIKSEKVYGHEYTQRVELDDIYDKEPIYIILIVSTDEKETNTHASQLKTS